MKRRFLLSILAIGAVVGLSGCGSDGEPDDGKVRVVATTTMISDMAQAIIGDVPNIELVSLMGPGIDPHTYNLPARSIAELNRADVVLYNGLKLEGRTEEIYEPLRDKGAVVLAIGSLIPQQHLILEGEHPDPHVWGNPQTWSEVVEPAAKAIAEKAPDHAAALETNAKAYVQQLQDLHTWAASRFEELSDDGRVVITSHDAFNYFGQAYSLEVLAPQGISTASDPGTADIAATIQLIKERGVKAVFTEAGVNPAIIERIAADTGAKIGGKLYSDSLGAAGEMKEGGGETYDVGTYSGMIKNNVNTIVDALK
ncbi:MAG: zinc ABC transporter substrate-binding protein [Verrucomicrobiota bacterium]